MAQRKHTPEERERIADFRLFLENRPNLEADGPRAVREYAEHLHGPADAGARHADLAALLLPVWEQHRTDRSIL